MSEDYRIVSPPHGEPRPVGDVGVRVRLKLSGYPSRRWSRNLCARLTSELVGHPSAAHLRMNVDELVQGNEIVLDGIEDRDTPGLANALQRAVAAANRGDDEEEAQYEPNVSQDEADAVARSIPVDEPGEVTTPDAGGHPPCPRCGRGVPVTAGDRAAGDQLALSELDCPGCGSRLVRDVQGHVDRGWRVAE